MKRLSICVLLSYLAVCSQASGQNYNISAPAGPESPSPKTAPAQKAQLVENYGKLPLSFEANTGQADNSVKFLSRGSGYGLYLTGAEAVLALHKSDCAGVAAAGVAQAASSARRPGLRRGDAGCRQTADVVRMRLAGASGGAPAPAGEEQLPGKVNYFTGNDPAKWHTGVPTYAKVRYRGVYPGVDLVYYGNQRQLEYDFVVAAGADPKPIRLQFAGAKGLRLGVDGDLVVTAAGGVLAFHKPVVYQLVDGQRKAVEGCFAMLSRRTVGFRLGSYDHAKPLVIDPVLVYSTYLGGSFTDGANAIAVDTAGNAYVAGQTESTDLPVTPGAFQTTLNAGLAGDAFITKLNLSGTALVYSTYLGGIGYNSANAIAVDTAGNAYVAGYTGASDFPVTPGAFQTTNHAAASGGSNAFIAKLNPAGAALVYSTYLGGSGSNTASGVAVDGSGSAYITGYTYSADFPLTPGAVQTANHAAASGSSNAFVTKLNPAGTALVYSTYLGGSGGNSVVSIGNVSIGPGDDGTGLAVDGSGNAYITGLAGSTDFPVTAGAFQTTNRASAIGLSNAFVTKLNPTGSALVYSTYLGGSSSDLASGVAVDGSGYVYVAGIAGSTDFPVTPGAFQTTNHAGHLGNAFLTKLNPAGTALVYSTYLGGSSSDWASGVAVDGSGNAYISGTATSDDFPVTPGALQTTNRASAIHETNVFVSKLDPAGSTLVYSTYLGGTGNSAAFGNNCYGNCYTYGGDNGYGLAVDGSGNTYIAGSTPSANFPVTQGAFQTANRVQPTNNYNYSIGTNAFVAKLNLGGTTTTSPGPLIASGGIVPVDSTEPAIQPGEWVSIFGTNLASSTATWNGDFPTSLGGTTVTIDGNAAYLSYVSPGQINLQAPDDTATGAVPVVVTTGSGTATADVTLAQVAPSFLLFDSKHVAGIILRQDGSGAYGQGADSYDLLGPTGTSLGFPTVAAKAGDIVELFGTGFGPTTPAVPAGQAFSGAAPATYEVALQINNVGVATIWVGMSGAGLDQINLTIPAGLGTGDVPLVAGISGGHTPLYETPSYVVISLQ